MVDPIPWQAAAATHTPYGLVAHEGIDFSKGVTGADLERRFHAYTLPQRLKVH